MTMLLLMVTIYMGTMLIFNPMKNQDTRKAAEILKELKKANTEWRDVDAQTLYMTYQQKLGQERGPAKMSQEQFDKLETEAMLLAAQAKLRGALARQGDPMKASIVMKKLNDAHMILQGHYERLRSNPVWQQPVAVEPSKELPDREVSPAKVYDATVASLSEKSKTDLVWGLVSGYGLIDVIVKMTGSNPGLSYWLAAFLLALAVRIAIYPWSRKQYMFSKQMMQLQPYVKEIQEKFKDKRTGKVPQDKLPQQQQEVMALYREYGINPLAGCGPALIQMPFFLFVYQCMLHYKFEFVKGHFLWMQDGADKFLGLRLAPNLGQTDHLLILVYAVSLVVSQLLMPVSDPTNVKQQRIIGATMSVVMAFFMFSYPLPSAFTLYWTFANILATAQAIWAYKTPSAPLQKVQSVPGGHVPRGGFMDRLQTMMEEAQKQQGGNAANGKSTGKSLPERPSDNVDPEFFGKTGAPRSKKKK